MKTRIDREKLKRRATGSHVASLGGILILLASTAISIWRPEWSALTAAMLFVGFATSTAGIYYANRWVKKPRPEDTLDHALKGLSGKYCLYHYELSSDHVLLTPKGVVVLETRNIEGQFSYTGGKWHQKVSISRALRFFVEERLGNPTTDAQAAAGRIQVALRVNLPDKDQVPVRAVVVFVHPAAVLGEIQNPPVPVCLPSKLRKRVLSQERDLQAGLYEQVKDLLDSRQA
jgi:hypothetical protein